MSMFIQHPAPSAGASENQLGVPVLFRSTGVFRTAPDSEHPKSPTIRTRRHDRRFACSFDRFTSTGYFSRRMIAGTWSGLPRGRESAKTCHHGKPDVPLKSSSSSFDPGSTRLWGYLTICLIYKGNHRETTDAVAHENCCLHLIFHLPFDFQLWILSVNSKNGEQEKLTC